MPGHISPNVWGPILWTTMHLIALGYPKEPTFSEKRAAKEFYESLTHLIPCPICKLHYQQHVIDNPLTPSLDSRHDLFQWTVKIHNLVNKELGKPECTEQDAMAFLHNLGERGRSPILTPEDLHAEKFETMIKQLSYILAGCVLLGTGYIVIQKYLIN